MAASRNTRSFIALFEGMGENLEDLFVKKPRAFYDTLKYKLNHLPQVNYELGIKFANENKLNDAIFRFRIALYLQPDFLRAHYNLGSCYVRAGKLTQAKQQFLQVLRIDPAHAETLFMLSAVDANAVPPSQRPSRMPLTTVHDFFNPLAANYDAIEAANQYQGTKVCVEALKGVTAVKTDLKMVDLGCGTGLAVRGLRAHAAHITGVDFCAAMVQVAQSVKVSDQLLFDAVVEQDLFTMAPNDATLAAADVVVCCNVAQFLGDLAPLLATLGASLKNGAHLLLTIEPFNTPLGYGVNIETGRFGHHPDAVKQLAAKAKLSIAHEGRTQLYPGLNAWQMLFTKEQA